MTSTGDPDIAAHAESIQQSGVVFSGTSQAGEAESVERLPTEQLGTGDGKSILESMGSIKADAGEEEVDFRCSVDKLVVGVRKGFGDADAAKVTEEGMRVDADSDSKRLDMGTAFAQARELLNGRSAQVPSAGREPLKLHRELQMRS